MMITQLNDIPSEAFQTQFVVRPLASSDHVAYRKLRQRILEMGDGRYFSDSYIRENALINNELWASWCEEKREHTIIGLFANAALIGIMMITQLGCENSPVVEWEATWLEPSYRSSGIAKLAYKKVQEWTMAQGFKYAAVYIRADNLHSQNIRKKQGFVYVSTLCGVVWADGSVADAYAYLVDLATLGRETHKQNAVHYLEEALQFLNGEGHAPPQETSVIASVS